MRILKLRFRNLNSLCGEWAIDFTAPDYASSGIFAITGPTGSGKTTILDGICLALYGETPRLGKITKSTNEIMSRQKWDCFSEVEFEAKDRIYRCYWGQKRANKKPDGNLQQPVHEICDADICEILESKTTAVVRLVEEITGMDFERFTRSVMLAQGGFAAFLNASPTERAPILEQITGTGIYSDISKKVHERTSAERKKLDILNEGLKAFNLLSDEIKKELSDAMSERTIEAEEVWAELLKIRQCISWVLRKEELEKDIKELESALASVLREKEEHKEELEKLSLARKAERCESAFCELEMLLEQQKGENVKYEKLSDEIPAAEAELKNSRKILEESKEELSHLKEDSEKQFSLIGDVRALDIKIEEISSRIPEKENQLRKLEDQMKDYSAGLDTCNLNLQKSRENLGLLNTWLLENSSCSDLNARYPVLEEKIASLCILFEELSKKRDELDSAVISEKKSVEDLGLIQEKLKEARCLTGERESVISELKESLSKVLEGEDLPYWRTSERKLITESEKLERILYRIEGMDKKSSEIKRITKEVFESKAELAKKTPDLQNLESRYSERKRMYELCEEKAFLKARVESLEAERKKLADNKPCPLCGSLHHPYASFVPFAEGADSEMASLGAEITDLQNKIATIKTDIAVLEQEIGRNNDRITELKDEVSNIWEELSPFVNEKEDNLPEFSAALILEKISAIKCERERISLIIEEAEKTGGSLSAAEAEMKSYQNMIHSLEREEILALNARNNAALEINRLKEESGSLESSQNFACMSLSSELSGFKIPAVTPENTDIVLETLQKLRGEYIEYERKKSAEESFISAEETKVREYSHFIKRVLEEMKSESDLLSRYNEDLDAKKGERFSLFKDKNPDFEDKSLRERISSAENLVNECLQKCSRDSFLTEGMKKEAENLLNSINLRNISIDASGEKFRKKLSESGFSSEKEYLDARILKEKLEALTELEESISNRETEFLTKILAKSSELKAEENKRLTDKNHSVLVADEENKSKIHKDLQKEIGAIEERFSADQKEREKMQDRLEEISLQKSELERFLCLHALIGSADGKKFRNFAQGLTFEIMISHANKQLTKMSDRYILLKNPDEPLDLCVLDNYQAGEIRPTKNLSGGESFIVSLALALGLSAMAGRKVRVDSLFLDEGFGTLDEKSLDTALETLAGLNDDGKLIGIISHVGAIKERIPARISVLKGSAGKSRISGPGCTENP
ncbi:AAA family ATPase [Methanoplanus sp. FWC-SCC4]|uniref:AAA family ATPase n=1 Tax=Methanochimaera problematica TaxID=2609417 RepID=A0AA97FD67_9EURY|nr:AAA family ATPase [Methanoplanus sp. FWC-SCC4]WOF17240.1 AAA family ATPase [Methanoplanus sp. FWC-SCC4]